MARISGVDLPRNKRMEIALTYLYGVGRNKAREILNGVKAELPAIRAARLPIPSALREL